MQISMPPARPPAGTRDRDPEPTTPRPGRPARRPWRPSPAPDFIPRLWCRGGTAASPAPPTLSWLAPRGDEPGDSPRAGWGTRAAPPGPTRKWGGASASRAHPEARWDQQRGQTGGPCPEGAHLPGSPSPGASAWLFRTRARRPPEREARPSQSGRRGARRRPRVRASCFPRSVRGGGGGGRLWPGGRGGRVSSRAPPRVVRAGPRPRPAPRRLGN